MEKIMKKCSSLKRTILLSVLVLLGMSILIAQNTFTVTGTVVDEFQAPLIGVSVVEKGTQNGTVTDVNGKYTLNIEKGVTLLFSYIGFASQEIVAAANEINITLLENARVLDDVVVVGYGVQKKSSVTGAIAQVKSEDMINRTITRPEQALQGKTAGVQIIQTSGSPGAQPQVRVRGYSSNASSSPLFVVDGIRTSNIGGLDPNDIASMEVLKDAASAAIYGAEAGNGVILITTKRGKAGKSKISYDYQLSSQSLARIPKMLNSEQYIDYMTEGNSFPLSTLTEGWDGYTNTLWTDVAFENSLMQKHSLSFQGGAEMGSYYLSLSYLDNDGIVKGNKDTYKRLTATVNTEFNVNSWLKLGTGNQIEKYNVNNVSENNEYGSFMASVLQLDPLTPDVYAADNLTSEMQMALANGKTLLQNEKGEYYAVSKFYASEQFHPIIMRDRTRSSNSGFNVNGSIFADLKPIKELVFTSRLGYRLSGTRNPSYSIPYYGNATQNVSYVGISSQSSTSIYYQWENFANYNKRIDKHDISAMAGMSFQESTYDFVRGELAANGEHAILKDDPLFGFLNYAAASATRRVSGEKTRTAKLSYFGRFGYTFDNRYMLQGSLRADAADLAYLPETNRWGYFPAVSAGWILTNEKFMSERNSSLSYLKLRASWGQNGSLAALGGYAYSTDMGSAGMYPYVNEVEYVTGVRPTSMGNDNLKWETAEQLNIGLDARFFKDRLTFAFDYFNKQTKDLLVKGTTPSLTIGGTTSPLNAGDVKNTGYEFELDWRDQIGDFNYGVRANLATLSNKVTYLDRSLSRVEGARFHTSGITYFEEGYPVYYFRGYKFDHVDPVTGDPVFVDFDDNGVINDDDKTYIGDAIPNFTYGITLTAAWKGIDLTVFGTGSQGNDIFNCIARADYPQSNKLKEIFYDGRWTPTNTNASVPRAASNYLDQYLISDAMVFDGSYFKVKQIQLGYTFPKRLLRKALISNLRVYASLDDFFTFTSYPGFDPEASAGDNISAMGIDKGSYPTSKKVVFGLNIEF